MHALFSFLATLTLLLAAMCSVPAQETPSKGIWADFPLPSSLWVQDEPGDFALRVLQRTLSGLATLATLSSNNTPLLWIRPGLVPDDRWRTLFTSRTGVPTQNVSSDVIALVQQYAALGVVRGYVVYSSDTDSVSINIATSLCAPLSAVAVADTLVSAFEAGTVLTQLADARTLSYADLMAAHTFNKDILTDLHTDQAYNRDMAVASGTLVVLDGAAGGGYAEGLATLNPGASVIGYGADEFEFVSAASRAGAGAVASDWTSNWAVLSSGPSPTLEPFPQRIPVQDDGRSFYVAFVLTDGDNLQWELNDFSTGSFWWAAPQRGTIPLTWGIPASALALSTPDALGWYQSTASSNDGFVNYADAYAYIDIFPSSAALSTFVASRQSTAHRIGVHSAVVFTNSWNSRNATAYNTFVAADPSVQAIFPLQYSSYAAGEGALLRTRSNVPVLSAKISLWNLGRNDTQFGDPAHVADVLNSWASGSGRGHALQNRVAWVPVHAWSTFAAPADAQEIATNGQLGGYSAALYASRKLAPGIKLVTLDDIASLLN
ncbi:hypothetical protein EXIGLDRAFT_833459 [Exidia glandulosa HHB12029]|uniref:Uncharacterized protein n=1 Tax=Exidia glandulosa HHB12029 TaxID=1314781 RepID=A0A165KNG1_EXIGL|nr:hypothetical protein EXIGLDRAFT_833459 [Exidia glandulosa HHB12029]